LARIIHNKRKEPSARKRKPKKKLNNFFSFLCRCPKKFSVCLAKTHRPTAKPTKGKEKEKEKETNDNS
jgi:hypothetical protein